MEIIQRAKQQIDNQLISSISKAVQAQRPGKALDLTTQLQLPKSVEVAIKLAVKAKVAIDELCCVVLTCPQFPQLAERMTLAQQVLVHSIHERQMLNRPSYLGAPHARPLPAQRAAKQQLVIDDEHSPSWLALRTHVH